MNARNTNQPRLILVLFTLLISLLSVLSSVQASVQSKWPIEIFDVMDNSKIIVFIKDDDINASPKWQPADGGPPMSIEGVLQEVNKWVKADASLKDLDINEIELKPINHHKGHWYYLVQLKSSIDYRQKPRFVAVLLSGKVVPAMVKPVSIK